MLKASEVTQISEELINFGSLIDEVAEDQGSRSRDFDSLLIHGN
jgi:hypothetical protein